MSTILIKKGLDLPIIGSPSKEIEQGSPVKKVAVLGPCHRGLKPSFLVKVNDEVKKGQVLFQDRTHNEIKYVAPAAGKIVEIYRGEKRAFLSVVIELNGRDDAEVRSAVSIGDLENASREVVKSKMLEEGLWSFLVERPYGHVPNPATVPSSIFVNAMDTNPLAPKPEIIINQNKSAFVAGLEALTKLTDGKVHLCKTPKSEIPHGLSTRVMNHLFRGVHPAGLSGTHIHHIDPINHLEKRVWSIGYQNVVALGKSLLDGRYFSERLVSLAGPQVKRPRILKTILGADLFDLTNGELLEGENRIISGSVLNGTQASEALGFLSPFDNIVSVLEEDRERVFHGFMTPGFNKFSVKGTFLSALNKAKKFRFGTSKEGSHRDIVPIGSYETVMPLDIIATFLVRSLLSNDLELAEKIGALELLEEDVALLTYVCPGKNDIGKHLNLVLEQIRKDNE